VSARPAAVAVALMLATRGVCAAQDAPRPAAPVPLRLVRCAAGSERACLVARLELDERAAGIVAGLDSAAESAAWSGDLGGRRLVGPGVAAGRAITPPLRLLVLLDRSGTMAGQGIAFTRITLKRFIEQLDSASVAVAVAGFESRRVAQGIAAATFVPPAEAAAALERIPPPDLRGNTALYSAMVEAHRKVTDALRTAPGTRGAILLVTDGTENDVGRPGDDPGLLAGPAGLAEAEAAAAASGHDVWIMRVGEGAETQELARLAGPRGRVSVVRLDPNALAARLATTARELRPLRHLAFGVPGGAAAGLARAPWSGNAAVWRNGTMLLARPLSWRPPLFALPAFQGVADPATLPAEIRDAPAGGSAGGVRAIIALFLAIVSGVLLVIVPRLAWRRRDAGAVTPAPPAPRAKPEAVARPAAGGLRADVSEAPPRKATDVTGEFPVQAVGR